LPSIAAAAPPAVRPMAQFEPPKRSTPSPRVPAPAHVETKSQPTAGAATERLIAHRDLRAARPPAEIPAPRVEFITPERVVTLLPKPAPADREQTERRREPAPLPKPEAPREAPPPPPRPAAVAKPEAKTPAPPAPAVRRETIAPAPAPSL